MGRAGEAEGTVEHVDIAEEEEEGGPVDYFQYVELAGKIDTMRKGGDERGCL